MKKRKKIVFAAIVCIVTGVAMAVAALASGGLDFSDLWIKTQMQTVSEPFTEISIFALNNDVRVLPSEDEHCHIHYTDYGSVTTVRVQDGTLTIRQTATERWYDTNAKNNKPIVLYLPQTTYENLNVTTARGSITVPQLFRFGIADIWSTAGNIVFYAGVDGELRLRNTDGAIRADLQVAMGTEACENVTVLTASGNIELTNINAARIDVRSTVGTIALSRVFADLAKVDTTESNIHFTGCDGQNWTINSVSGNIRGSVLSPKQFSVFSGLGDTEYPPSQVVSDQFTAVTHGGIVRITMES